VQFCVTGGGPFGLVARLNKIIICNLEQCACSATPVTRWDEALSAISILDLYLTCGKVGKKDFKKQSDTVKLIFTACALRRDFL